MSRYMIPTLLEFKRTNLDTFCDMKWDHITDRITTSPLVLI